MKDKNPYHICTWEEDPDCKDCINKGVLHCRWELGVLLRFLLPAFIFSVSAFAGMVLAGIITRIWWPAAAYAVFWIFFFLFFEIRILCSHCPFYAERSRVLHCLANHGALKFFKYRPGPMNMFEKISLLVCFAIFACFPLGIEIYGIVSAAGTTGIWGIGLWLVAASGLTLGAGIWLFAVLRTYLCPKCVNFSCPFNLADEKHIKAYLERNPVMRQAWEKAGYKLV